LSDIFKFKTAYINYLSVILLFLAIAGCSGCDDNPTTSDNPEIYDLIAPDSLIKGLPDTTLIYLSLRDPQGLEDIDSVFFTVDRPDGTTNGFIFYMFDDGVNGGDSLAEDGIYTQGIQSPSMSSQTGDYLFHFSARDKSGNMSNTINKSITAYESAIPVIRRITANQYDSQRRQLFISAYVLDAQGSLNIERVWAEVTYLDQDSLYGEFDLNDFSNDGDSTALDNIYSLDLRSQQDGVFAEGSYFIEFNAIDYEGNSASPVDTTIVIDSPVLF